MGASHSRHHLQEQAPAVLQSEGALLDSPVAVIAHPRPGNIRVAGIHPAPPTHAPSSWAGTLHSLQAWNGERSGMPLVLAGEFNATDAHPEIRG